MIATAPPILLSVSTWDRVQGIREALQRGGRLTELAIPSVVLIAIAVLVVWLYRRQLRRTGRDLDHPGKLFRTLLRRLDLTVPQRELLRHLAAHRKLDQPAVLLLSRRLFEHHSQIWLDETGEGADQQTRVAGLAARLFPAAGQGNRKSTSAGPPAEPTDPST